MKNVNIFCSKDQCKASANTGSKNTLAMFEKFMKLVGWKQKNGVWTCRAHSEEKA